MGHIIWADHRPQSFDCVPYNMNSQKPPKIEKNKPKPLSDIENGEKNLIGIGKNGTF